MKFSNFSVGYFCSYKKSKTIPFLNSIIFKNRFLENYAYHIKIKQYVSNIFQQKKWNAKKNLGSKSSVEWPIRSVLMINSPHSSMINYFRYDALWDVWHAKCYLVEHMYLSRESCSIIIIQEGAKRWPVSSEYREWNDDSHIYFTKKANKRYVTVIDTVATLAVYYVSLLLFTEKIFTTTDDLRLQLLRIVIV